MSVSKDEENELRESEREGGKERKKEIKEEKRIKDGFVASLRIQLIEKKERGKRRGDVGKKIQARQNLLRKDRTASVD